MTGTDYNVALSIFMVPYIIAGMLAPVTQRLADPS